MLLFYALKHPSLFLLWIGQLLSAIGSEVYRIAFTWILVGMIGPDTGYILATQVLAIIVVALLSEQHAEHWNPYKTLIHVDIASAFFAMIPIAAHFLGYLNLTTLWISSIGLFALSALFEPVLFSLLPEHAHEAKLLQSTNGLMSTTLRTARLVAPSIVAALTGVLATVDLFALDSLSFVFSATTIFVLWKHPKFKNSTTTFATSHTTKINTLKNLQKSVSLMKKHADIYRVFILRTLMASSWWCGYFLALVVMIKERFPNNINAYGGVIGAYGLGNIISSLWFGNFERKHFELQMYSGYLCIVVGFIGMALSPSLLMISAFAALTAFSGPMNELPFNDLLQLRFRGRDLSRLYRLRMLMESAGVLLVFILAPSLIKAFGPRNILMGLGLIVFMAALYGFRSIKSNKTA